MTAGLALRSALWAVLLPGIVAGYLPWRFYGLREVHLDLWDSFQLIALAVILIGALGLGTCIVEFARSGRGTLAPVDPPRELVVQGLYQYVRNPMYVSVATILLGEVLLSRSSSLVIYALIWFALANVFVLSYEEPKLREQFGASYAEYCRRVHRWIPMRPLP